MHKSVSLIRKIFIGLVGFPILIFGLILIPVPGPGGIPVTLLGLFILSFEFDWAKRHVERAKSAIRDVVEKARKKS